MKETVNCLNIVPNCQNLPTKGCSLHLEKIVYQILKSRKIKCSRVLLLCSSQFLWNCRSIQFFMHIRSNLLRFLECDAIVTSYQCRMLAISPTCSVLYTALLNRHWTISGRFFQRRLVYEKRWLIVRPGLLLSWVRPRLLNLSLFIFTGFKWARIAMIPAVK